MHRAIARRWFAALGAAGEPTRRVHDTVSGLVYGAIRLAGAAVGVAVDARLPVERRGADSVQAIVNGLWGDALGRHEERLGITMGVRDAAGTPVSPDRDLAAAFPTASAHLVVLVHGLVKTERCWRGAEGHGGIYAALEDHPGLTPVAVRYNSGLRVSQNGEKLASLLEEVVSAWPVPVRSIALVGHSMGGLVVRSACALARAAGHRWIDGVHSVVAIATPHRGAPLEKAVNLAAWCLGVAPETRPLGDFLNGRSVGIKDLRFGAIAEEDWSQHDPDALLANTVADHPLLPGIDHHFITSVVTSRPSHPIGMALGDLLVRAVSGSGGRRADTADVVLLGGLNHFEVLHQSEVIDRVMGWVEPPPLRPVPADISRGRGRRR
jgi:hypothetical protein